jgi:hypothetical protein
MWVKGWLFFLLFWSSGLFAQGADIESVTISLKKDHYEADVRIKYHLSDKVTKALKSGVMLSFEMRVQIRAKDAWWWAQDLLDRRFHYRLRYHALADVYELFFPGEDIPQRFVTRDSALRALGEIKALPLIPHKHMAAGDYEVHLQTKLDIEALPVPLRPVAYLSSDWSLSGVAPIQMVKHP